jgi:serine protease Do
VAVGNAYGYEHTVTQGIVSALHRTVQVSDYQRYENLIQTDASINPGNSGGPLLNIDGDMIGINVAVRVGAQGIGFAIPVNEALEVAAELLASERASRVSHGVELRTHFDAEGSHVAVEEVHADSPASAAGLQTGDVIVRAEDNKLARRLDWERAVLERQPGDEVRLDILREGQTRQITLVLEKGTGARPSASDNAWEQLGLRLAAVPAAAFRKYRTRYRGGMKVMSVRPDSPASRNGIRHNDILLGMHKWETISQDNVAYILNSAEFKATQPFKFYILRGSETLYGNMMVDPVN